MKPTGFSAISVRASSWSSTAKPRGLSRSDAILARNLFADRPTDTVMPMSRSICAAKRASTFAGIMPCRRSVPDRSRNASSIDSGVEGVAIDMGEVEMRKCPVSQEARRAAGGAASRLRSGVGQAVPAETGNGAVGLIHRAPPLSAMNGIAQCLARGGDGGRGKLRKVGERLHGLVIPHDEIQHSGQEAGVRCGTAERLWPDTALGQELPQAGGVAGEKSERANRHDFSHFRRAPGGLFGHSHLPFRNLSALIRNHHARVIPAWRRLIVYGRPN